MSENRRVRLIRKHERGTPTGNPTAVEPSSPKEPSEREIRTVVSRWVRDHRQRSEEFRRNFTALLSGGEVHLPTR